MTFIITYWTQVAIILSAIGYIISKIVEYSFKRKEIKFNSFHLERANYIRNLYTDLYILKRSFDRMETAHDFNPANFGPTKTEWLELFQDITEQIRIMKEKEFQHKILFPKKFTDKLDDFFNAIRDELLTPSLVKNGTEKTSNESYVFQDTARFKKYYNLVFPDLLDDLEKDFRKYL